MEGNKTNNSSPKILVIILVYNDSKGLLAAVRSLINQNYPKSFYEIPSKYAYDRLIRLRVIL